MAFGKVSGCVLVAVCLVAMADAFNYDRVEGMTIDDSSENDLETVQVNEAMANFEQLQQLFDLMEEQGGSCRCVGLWCQCCVNIKVLKFRVPFCLGLSYNPQFGTVTATLTMDGRRVFQKTFYVSRSIPPLCLKFKVARLCLQFYDFRVVRRSFTGCSKISVSVFGLKKSFDVGCFRFNYLDSSMQLPFAEFPVVEAASIEKSVIENSDGSFDVEEEVLKEIFGGEGRVIEEDNES